MKKTITILCATLCMLLLPACATQSNQASTSTASEPYKTMGEAMSHSGKDNFFGYSIGEGRIKIMTDEYVCEAPLTDDLQAKLDAIPFDADDKDEQYAEILKDVPVESIELRANSQLTDEQRSSLIGKKGQELLDLGFEYYGYNLSEENAQFFLDKNGYTYIVVMEEHYEERDDMDPTELISKSTIKEIKTEF